MMDLGFVERLLELLGRSEAETIEIRRWHTTIRVSKRAGGGPEVSVTSNAKGAPAVAVPAPAVAAGSEGAGDSGDGEVAAAPIPLTEIRSPMVGTFYAKPEPGADPYVQVGMRIAPLQTLCIIEAMKIMNPLDAEIAGVIREITVEDAQPVEYGQVLFKVDTNG